MLTPDSPDRQYSTRLRTALVLTGSGTAGAYHAGVLRALHEAGVKIDLVAGRGVGAIGAYFSAVDGGARLWEDKGLWRGAPAAGFYGWRGPVRVAGWALTAAAILFAVPLALLVFAVLIGIVGLLLTLVGLGGPGAALTGGFTGWIADALRALGAADRHPAARRARARRRRRRARGRAAGRRDPHARPAPHAARPARSAHRRAAVRADRSSTGAPRNCGT